MADSPFFTREGILEVLKGMNIDISPTTKLPIDKLEQRLQKALDAAQRFNSIFPKNEHSTVNPTTYPIWDKNKPLRPTFLRETYASPLHIKEVDIKKEIPPDIDAFPRVSDHINDLSTEWDNKKGRYTMFLRDPISKHSLIIKTISVHKINSNIPLIFVGYNLITEIKGWEEYRVYVEEFLEPQEIVVISWVTFLEQNLFLKLLSQNHKRISTDFQPPPNADKRLTFSFFIPITGIKQKDVVRLSKNSGCVVCGQNTASTCSACLSVQYCGKNCQRNDWRTHKHFCRSITSGKWYTVTLDRNPKATIMHLLSNSEINQLRHQPAWNRLDCTTDKIKYRNFLDPSPFPNIYDNGEYFLIKIQRPLAAIFGQRPRDLHIYDGKKSFELFLLREREPEAFQAALEAIGNDMKIYRWACRVGEFQWKICFDRAPENDPSW